LHAIDFGGALMKQMASFPRPVAIVLGCGDVGSAVALALHQADLAVVLVEVDPGGVALRCYGVGAGPRRIAACVMSTFAGRFDPAAAL
jgi:2-polyprenyl-6-methoxyphenol hydroxylase-like FAD-dependent oxidoreductase